MSEPGWTSQQEAIQTLSRASLEDAEPSGLTSLCVSRIIDGHPFSVMWASDVRARELDDLQSVLREGPALSALSERGPILVPDLSMSWRSDWVAFGREAVALGVASVCAFPLQIGMIDLGVVTLHGPVPATLTGPQLQSQLRICDAFTGVLLSTADTPEGWAASPDDPDPPLTIASQAAGMMMVQLDTTIGDAMLRLRSHAYASGRTLADVAKAVVSRTLRFTPEASPPGDALSTSEPNDE